MDLDRSLEARGTLPEVPGDSAASALACNSLPLSSGVARSPGECGTLRAIGVTGAGGTVKLFTPGRTADA
eukprot:11669069-Alexandrium_andersonii.AAC.1